MDSEVVLFSWLGVGASEGPELSLGGVSPRNWGWRAEDSPVWTDSTVEALFFTLSEVSLKGSLRTLGIWTMELSLEFRKGKEALQDCGRAKL